jgi:phage gp46-like protein
MRLRFLDTEKRLIREDAMMTATLISLLTKEADRGWLALQTEPHAGMRRAIRGRVVRLEKALRYLWQRAAR